MDRVVRLKEVIYWPNFVTRRRRRRHKQLNHVTVNESWSYYIQPLRRKVTRSSRIAHLVSGANLTSYPKELKAAESNHSSRLGIGTWSAWSFIFPHSWQKSFGRERETKANVKYWTYHTTDSGIRTYDLWMLLRR